MPKRPATQRTCPNGHKYWKSTDCPTCPRCEELRLGGEHYLPKLSAPAKRALENAGITSIKQLARRRETDVMKLHGMGPSSLPKLKEALKKAGLSFKA
jgi:predicted RecB family nuclease